jgi:hypothetical protein
MDWQRMSLTRHSPFGMEIRQKNDKHKIFEALVKSVRIALCVYSAASQGVIKRYRGLDIIIRISLER